MCGKKISKARLLDGLKVFQGIIQTAAKNQVAAQVAANFEICQALNSSKEKNILATGYYQPILQGSLIRQGDFQYPLYGIPPDMVLAGTYQEEYTEKVGRIENGRFVPYWTRAEIDTNDKLLLGSELVYLKDPFDAFTLHVQGSGLVQLSGESIAKISYAGSNGWPYKSIGKLLVDEGKIPLEEVSMPKIRHYLNEHLDDLPRILHYNDRYIFFRLEKDPAGQNPIGTMGQPLTPGRSVALDMDCFPIGGLYFLESQQPEIEKNNVVAWQPMQRFVLHQDSGSAIKGSGRLDFFWGRGNYAEIAAGNMKQLSRLYMLVPKNMEQAVKN